MICYILTALFTGFIVLLVAAKRIYNQRLSKAFANAIKNSKDRNFSPENTIIVFDIHGVLFTPNYREIVKIVWASPYKYRCLQYMMYPSTWIDYAQLKRDQVIFERFMAHFLEKYPALQPCMSLIIAVVNAQKPIAGTIALVERLHQMGYTLHIISNIGEPIGKDLQGKFVHVFRYFKAFKTPTAKNKYKTKSQAVFFREYVQEHNRTGKHVLFIDDNVINLETARMSDIEGLYFSRPEQLKKDLGILGIPLSAN